MAVFMTGGGKAPIVGKKASDFAVGESVFLNENGTPVEYLVVNQGIPSASSLYDSSCDGLWLLRKDVYNEQANDSSSNTYSNSDIHTYLNEDFLGLFDADTQAAIKQVKIPYAAGASAGYPIKSGADGLDAKIFLLSIREVDYTGSSSYAPEDGACPDYFNGADDSTKIAYLDGTATWWHLRSPNTNSASSGWYVTTTGGFTYGGVDGERGIRPALILSANAVFDGETRLFKGVA